MDAAVNTTPTAVAFAIAAISVGLPHSHSTAFAKLAVIAACCAVSDWSDASQIALVRQATDWLGIAHHLRLPIPAIQGYEQTALLKMLTGEAGDVAEPLMVPAMLL